VRKSQYWKTSSRGYERVKAVKGSVFWDIMLCSPLDAGSKQKLAVCFMLISCLAYSSALKMELTCSSETLVGYQRTTCVISKKIEFFITNNSKLTLVSM
jgi:hypothetical protein